MAPKKKARGAGSRIKKEKINSENNDVVLKLKENDRKNSININHQKPKSSPINKINTIKPVSINKLLYNNPLIDEQPEVAEDSESIKGRFGWKAIGKYFVPYVKRVIESEHLNFVSVRMVETQLLNIYLRYLHVNVYSFVSVESYFITENEARLFNEINEKYSEHIYGEEKFIAGKDFVVRLDEAYEFYMFVDLCYTRLLSRFIPSTKEKCGFIRINSEHVVPYSTKDDKKYIPLFYFEGELSGINNQAIKLEKWELAYLKFCCKVQGIKNELFDQDSCIVVTLDEIKSHFPPETNFEDYWPAKVIDQQFLTNWHSTRINPTKAWLKKPSSVLTNAVAPSKIKPTPYTLTTEPQPSTSTSLNQNGLPPNQMNPIVFQHENSFNPVMIQPPNLVQSNIPMARITQMINPRSFPNIMIQPTTFTAYNQETYGYNASPSSANHLGQYYGGQPIISQIQYLQQLSNNAYQIQQPSTSTYQIQQPSTSTYHGHQPSTSTYQIQQPSTSTYQIQQPSTSTYQGQQPSTSSYQIQQPSTNGVQTQQPTTNDVQTQQPSTNDVQTQQPTTEDVQTQQPTTNDVQTQQLTTNDVQTQHPTTNDVQTQQQSPYITSPTQSPSDGPTTAYDQAAGPSARVIKTKQRKSRRQYKSVDPFETIDLTMTSPPSSPNPSSSSAWPEQALSKLPVARWHLIEITEHHSTSNWRSDGAYKIQKATFQKTVFYAINAKAYVYSSLMISVNDLVHTLFPTTSVARCTEIMYKCLKMKLFSGNSNQLAMLKANGRISSDIPEDTPLALLVSVKRVFPQLKTLLQTSDEDLPLHELQDVSSAKRQRAK